MILAQCQARIGTCRMKESIHAGEEIARPADADRGLQAEVSYECQPVKYKDLTSTELAISSWLNSVSAWLSNEPLIHEAVRSFLANRASWYFEHEYAWRCPSGLSAKASEAKGQPGARALPACALPLWKGGGNAHGAQPRDWAYNLPRIEE